MTQPIKLTKAELDKILKQFYENAFNETAESGDLDESLLIARYDINALLKSTLNDCLPEKQNRKPDEDYMYCITCNQNIDSLESDCFCTVHNLAIDTVIANFKRGEQADV